MKDLTDHNVKNKLAQNSILELWPIIFKAFTIPKNVVAILSLAKMKDNTQTTHNFQNNCLSVIKQTYTGYIINYSKTYVEKKQKI